MSEMSAKFATDVGGLLGRARAIICFPECDTPKARQEWMDEYNRVFPHDKNINRDPSLEADAMEASDG